ncbi:MAG TPA: hypothetical protein VK463_11495 [Desulfomonilaceae bacterium]|nr:hypothetical protein [Desulfomonilaceae bacterium]
MIKDLFGEVMRRMEWAKERNLLPEIHENVFEYVCRIPIDETVAYTISFKEIKDQGVLIRTFFPDGDPHHYLKIAAIELEEAIHIVNTAALIVYGRSLVRAEAKKTH